MQITSNIPKPSSNVKNSTSSSNTNKVRTRDVTCFKCQGRGHIASACPTLKTMILKEDGSFESETDEEDDEMPRLVEKVEKEVVEIDAEAGQVFVNLRALQTQVVEHDQQRHNIFHTKCRVMDKVCLTIIDPGSCTNVASSYLVDNLKLPTIKHPTPYRLQWLNDCGNLRVTRQVNVPFSIGKYEDEVLCDVVPMEASHLLLGRPWGYDRRVKHDGYTNKYSFVMNGHSYTLKPLSPPQVQECNLRMIREREKRMKEQSPKDESTLDVPKRSSNDLQIREPVGNNFFASPKSVEKCFAKGTCMILMLFRDNSVLLTEVPSNLPKVFQRLL